MKLTRFPFLIGVSHVLMILSAMPSLAQEPYAILAVPIPFDFLNPGARSLALGSAFTGLADDATAAFTNPAGLVQLLRPEVSFEGRYRGLTGSFLERGRFGGGPVTGLGIDTATGPEAARVTDKRFGPSFASIVIPRSKWAVAGYRHEVLKSSQTIVSQGGIFHDSGFQDAGMQAGDSRISGFEASRSIELVTYGASVAVKGGERFSAGGGLTFSRATLRARADQLESSGYAPATPLVKRARFLRQVGASNGFGVLGGVQWNMGDPIRVGVAYRRSPSFEYEQEGTGRDEESCGDGTVDGAVGAVRWNSCRFKVPDVISVGVATRLSQAFLATFEYSRVSYSQLKNDYVRRLAEFDFSLSDFVLEDGNEFHAGVEYVFSQTPMTPAVRGGVWWAPDNSVRFDVDSQLPSEFVSNTFFKYVAALLPGQPARVHATGGAGLSVSKKFEINGALDLSRDLVFFTASAVVRF